MFAVGAFMGLVEVTIILTKTHAAIFAGGMVTLVLTIRTFMHWRAARRPEMLPEPAIGWLAELRTASQIPSGGPRIMFAARGRELASYAVHLARQKKATLFAIYVRTLRVMDMRPGQAPRIDDDPDAQAALGTTAVLAREAGIPFVPVYVVSQDVAAEILDYTVTFACDLLIMGKSQRTLFSRTVAGDVLAKVAAQLPDGVALVTRGPGPFERPEEVKSAAPADRLSSTR
jgi:nucleotide-binding universal stress UspA family protein